MSRFILLLLPCLFSIFTVAQKSELTVTLTDPDGNLASGTVKVTGSDTTLGKSLEEGSAYYVVPISGDYDNDTLTFRNVNPGAHSRTAQQELTAYDHAWTGQVTSNLKGKTIADGTPIKIWSEDAEDTLHTTLENETYSLETTLNEPETNYKLIITGAPGHKDNTITGTSTGTNNLDIKLKGLTYQSTIPLNV